MRISIDDRKFIWLAVIVVAVLLRHSLIAASLPFVLALALAAVIEPLVTFLQTRARVPRALATIAAMTAVVIAGGYLFLLVSTKVLGELVQMGALLQRYRQLPVEFAAIIIRKLDELNEIFDQQGIPAAVQDNILRAVDDFTAAGVSFLTQGINFVLSAVSRVPSLVVVVVIALLATYFILKDRDRITEASLSLLPEHMRERARDVQRKISVDLVGFFKAQLVLFALTTVVTALGLIIIGVNYWMTLAIVAGILDLIPVVGPGLLLVPWAVGAWTLGYGTLAIEILLLFVGSFLVRQIFQAKIVGDFIGVHPLTMLVALYAGIHLFGVSGFIVAPVLVIIAKGFFHFRSRT